MNMTQLTELRHEIFTPSQHRAARHGMTELQMQIWDARSYIEALESALADPHLDERSRETKQLVLDAWRPFLQRLMAAQSRVEAMERA